MSVTAWLRADSRSPPLINLARIRSTDVVTFFLGLPQVAHGIRPRGDSLRLQRLERTVRRRTELVGNDTQQVLLERQLINYGEGVPGITKYFNGSAIGPIVELNWNVAGRVDPHSTVLRQNNQLPAV